jgi:hypothetical protein
MLQRVEDPSSQVAIKLEHDGLLTVRVILVDDCEQVVRLVHELTGPGPWGTVVRPLTFLPPSRPYVRVRDVRIGNSLRPAWTAVEDELGAETDVDCSFDR